MNQSPLEACPCPFSCGLVVEDHLELVSLIHLQCIYNFDCSMLLYYLFWMLMGLFIHFYIIFGTNLLTQGPVQIAVFLPISVFRRKGISNGIQTE